MPKKRPSTPGRPPSAMSSSSGSSFLTAHESRRSIYPGMQARVSDADESETSRRPRRGAFPGILESDHEAEESYSPKDPPTQSAGTYSQMSGPRDSNAQYSHNTTNDSRSIPSQASMSDYSLSPRDSISNRGSRPSDRSNYDQHSRAPRSHSNIPHHHPRFASDDDDDYSPPRNLVYLPKRDDDDDDDEEEEQHERFHEPPSLSRRLETVRRRAREDPFAPRTKSGRLMTSKEIWARDRDEMVREDRAREAYRRHFGLEDGDDG